VTQRAVPFYCPYCGDEDLQPYEDKHGAWWCQSCRRAWSLSMIGTGTPQRMADAGGSAADPVEKGTPS
jgi:transposase-like protein